MTFSSELLDAAGKSVRFKAFEERGPFLLFLPSPRRLSRRRTRGLGVCFGEPFIAGPGLNWSSPRIALHVLPGSSQVIEAPLWRRAPPSRMAPGIGYVLAKSLPGILRYFSLSLCSTRIFRLIKNSKCPEKFETGEAKRLFQKLLLPFQSSVEEFIKTANAPKHLKPAFKFEAKRLFQKMFLPFQSSEEEFLIHDCKERTKMAKVRIVESFFCLVSSFGQGGPSESSFFSSPKFFRQCHLCQSTFFFSKNQMIQAYRTEYSPMYHHVFVQACFAIILHPHLRVQPPSAREIPATTSFHSSQGICSL